MAAGSAEEGSSAGAAVFASAASECLGWLGGQEETQHCSTPRTKPQLPPAAENRSFVNESGLVEFCNVCFCAYQEYKCTQRSVNVLMNSLVHGELLAGRIAGRMAGERRQIVFL